ncbi:MAG TPA: site-2 protease family protein [Kofleriaceae bacterium]|jgi:stage IV sporulation protein FB|nr:site-2 protease family protein [Kofleriaceae bacterium]
MFTSWRLGRVLGFPVEINLSFVLLLVAVLLGYGGASSAGAGLLVIGLVFGSVLLHELGHALVARRYGVHVSGIELSFFGGAAKMVQMPRSANHEIAIAAAGPAVSLMLAGAGLGLGGLLHASLLGDLFGAIGWINLVLAGFNLIPALPMDGGRILRAVLTRRMDFVRATDVAVDVARVVAIGFGVVGLALGWLQLLVLAPLLWIMSTRERMLARAMVDQYAGYGRSGAPASDPFDRWGRAAGRFDRPSSSARGPGGLGAGNPYDGPLHGEQPRRYTVRQVGGRLVIESID